MTSEKLQSLLSGREYETILDQIGSVPVNELRKEELLILIKTYIATGEFNTVLDLIDQVRPCISALPEIRQLEFFHQSLIAFYRAGKYDNGLEFLEDTRRLHEKIDYDSLDQDQRKTYASFYNHAGVLNYAKNNVNEALNNYEILKKLGEKNHILIVSLVAAINIGVIYDQKWQYRKSIRNYEQALQWASELDIDRYKLTVYNNLSYIYNNFGELDRAQDIVSKGHKLAIKLKDRVTLSKILTNRGDIHRKLGKLTQARDDFLAAYEIKAEVGNNYECILTLLHLIETYLLLDQRDYAVRYLRKMRQHAEDLSEISYDYKLAEALYLKGSALIRHRFKAEQIFREIINGDRDKVPVQDRLLATLHLLELLILQVDEEIEQDQLTDDERSEIESELLNLYHQILEMQDEIDSPLIQLQIHHIRAYLHLFFLQPELVHDELNKAQKIFEETGVKSVDVKGPDPTLLAKFSTISSSLHQSLNNIIHVEPRLKILIALLDNPKLVFRDLQHLVGLTPGNLGRHADKLVEAGYVDKRKEIVDDRFLTVYSITPEGLNEFERYKAILKPHLA